MSPTKHDDIKPVPDSPRHKPQDDNLDYHRRKPQDNDNLDYHRHKHQGDNPGYFDPVPDKHNLDTLDLDMNDVWSGGYRVNCLEPNNIYFRLPSSTLPHTVALLTDQILTGAVAPDPLAILAAMMHKLDDLGTHGCSDVSVRLCLDGLFPTTLPLGLRTCYQRGIARHLIPTCPDVSYTLPQPQPNLLYGYSIWTAFTQAQQTMLKHIHPKIPSYTQATPEVTFPFFVAEIKAAAGTGGSLWDAANQCAGGATACLQALDQLNTALSATACQGRIPNICYSLAIDNNLGQLYASWKGEDGSTFYIQRVASYLLSDAQHFARLYACVAAILKWGATTRLQDIRVAVDYIRGEGLG